MIRYTYRPRFPLEQAASGPQSGPHEAMRAGGEYVTTEEWAAFICVVVPGVDDGPSMVPVVKAEASDKPPTEPKARAKPVPKPKAEASDEPPAA